MESKLICKNCNGKGTVIVPQMPVRGSDGEMDMDFDVVMPCGCMYGNDDY